MTRNAKLTARTADKHVLYQKSVQSPEAECDFFTRIYRRHRGRPPTLFREDFCGTFLISCEWVRRRRAHRAIGVDLHEPTLEWGRRHNLAALPPHAAERVRLMREDVRRVTRPRVDVVGAFNFSYFIFKQRRDLLAYFTAVRRSLAPRGLFVLDAYGGYEAQQVMAEETKHRGFTYVWDQADYNPINDHARCYIHFTFPDGSRMNRAFTYDWRLWTLGGIRDALIDAGFKETEVYWEGSDRKGEGNGIYRRCKKAENTPGWNAYIIGLP